MSADGILPNLYRKEEAPPVGALRTRWRHLRRRVNVSVSTAIAPTPAGKAIKRRPAWATLTCVGLKEDARWRVCGCDRGARLAAIAPMPVGKMVNRIGVGDVDAQWFRRASNPHPPDRCGRSAMLSYGTVLPAHTAHPMGVHAHGLEWWDGHPATPTPSTSSVVSSHAIATVQESTAHTRIVWTRRVPCVVPTGFEPAAFRFGGGRSLH